MKIHWRTIPLIRIIVAYSSGIWIENQWQGHEWIAIVITAIAFAMMILLRKHHRWTFVSGYVLMMLFVSLAYLRSAIAHPDIQAKHYMHHLDEASHFIGIVKEIPIKKKAYRTEMEMQYIIDKAGQCHTVMNAIMLYFDQHDTLCKQYKPGDRLIVSGNMTAIHANSNPHAFDYKQYLYQRGISHQVYAQRHLCIGHHQWSCLFQWAMDARAYCLSIFHQYMTTPERAAILSAMVVGFRHEVSDDINQAFLDTGAVHILAVSGMHLVFLAAMLQWLFKKIKWIKGYTALIATIAILWFFTLVTGAAPAIVRAAIMFTLILIGKQERAAYNVFNILACCALIMLVYDPYLLFQIGFLFSYVALISLAFFQPYIQTWWTPTQRWLAYIWEYISVAIAAQVLMWPLVIYFFHQWPTYFIISGLLPVVLSNLAMNLSIALLSFSSLSALAWCNQWIVAPLLNMVMTLFIQSVVVIKYLPYGCIDGLTLSSVECALLMAGLMALIIYLQTYRIQWLYTIGAVVLACIISMTMRFHQANHQSIMTIYDVPKSACIDIFDGRKLYTYSKESLPMTVQINAQKNNRLYRMASDTSILLMNHDFYMERWQKVGNVFRFKRTTFAIIEHEAQLRYKYDECDYIIIAANIPYQSCFTTATHATVVLPNQLTMEVKKSWLHQRDNHQIYNIATQGALTINMAP